MCANVSSLSLGQNVISIFEAVQAAAAQLHWEAINPGTKASEGTKCPQYSWETVRFRRVALNGTTFFRIFVGALQDCKAFISNSGMVMPHLITLYIESSAWVSTIVTVVNVKTLLSKLRANHRECRMENQKMTRMFEASKCFCTFLLWIHVRHRDAICTASPFFGSCYCQLPRSTKACELQSQP